MRTITDIHEIQRLELDILKCVADFCEENKIRYFLAGGTLLGAIRHKGFIPWDDDIDISMPRKDFERFVKMFAVRGNYKVLDISNCKNYAYPFAKVVDTRTRLLEDTNDFIDCEELGVYIDVFPMDGVEDDLEKAKPDVRKTALYAHRLGFAVWPRKTVSGIKKLKRIFWILYFLVPGRRWYYRQLSLRLSRKDFDQSRCIASSFGARAEKEIIEREAFGAYLYLPFEQYSFRCPVGYDQYLRQMYGAYMQLPPEEDRVAKHETTIFWKDAC